MGSKTGHHVTICIAALYGEGAGVVLASDRMVTAHFPIGYEFEHSENTKIVALNCNGSVRALIAGDVLRGNEILDAAQLKLALNEGGCTASEAAEAIRASYQEIRLSIIVRRELEPRGLDLNNYYGRH